MKSKLTINKILLAAAAGIFLGVTAATAVFIRNKKVSPGAGLRKIESQSLLKKDGTSFDLIGLLRITTKTGNDDIRHILVVNPWIEYDKNDSELYEELDRKLVGIKAAFSSYFSSRTKDEILSMTEEQIKDEILAQINGNLVLGKIQKIYFREFIFLN